MGISWIFKLETAKKGIIIHHMPWKSRFSRLHTAFLSGSYCRFRLQGVCKLIEFAAGNGFTLEQCQQDYCQDGLEGYENFIAISVRPWPTL